MRNIQLWAGLCKVSMVVLCWCWLSWQRAFDAWSVTELPTSRASDLHQPGRWKVISGLWWRAEPRLGSSQGPAVLIKISDVLVTLALLPRVCRDTGGQDRGGVSWHTEWQLITKKGIGRAGQEKKIKFLSKVAEWSKTQSLSHDLLNSRQPWLKEGFIMLKERKI